MREDCKFKASLAKLARRYLKIENKKGRGCSSAVVDCPWVQSPVLQKIK